jgi:hypothetical protein
MGNLDQYYYLSIMGDVGHEIRAILEGSDGYHNTWTNFGSIWTDQIHNEKARSSGIVDYLQVQDLQTGETAYFRFPCGEGAVVSALFFFFFVADMSLYVCILLCVSMCMCICIRMMYFVYIKIRE